jgi:cbb3-type cytochrome oxidase cytochrome c subunit
MDGDIRLPKRGLRRVKTILPLLLLVALAAACSTESTPTPAPRSTPPAAATQPAGGGGAQGQAVFTSKGCTACHTLQSVPGATGEIGPDLTHVGTTAATRKPGMSADAYIRESVLTPSAFIVEGYSDQMPQLVQAGAELDALVAFLVQQK